VANDPRKQHVPRPRAGRRRPSLSPSTIGAEGLKALERAAAIVDADPDASPATGGRRALPARGLATRHAACRNRARSSYERAWQAAGAGARGRQAAAGAVRRAAADSLRPARRLDRFARRPPEEIVRQDVEIELTVTADGGHQ